MVAIDRETPAQLASTIKTDNFLAGKMAAKEMMLAFAKKGKSSNKHVVIFRFSKKVTSTTLRAQGFIAGAKEYGLEIIDDRVLGTTVGKIRSNYHLWKQQGLKIDGIFAVNGKVTTGILLMLQEKNKNKSSTRPVMIGFDFNKIYLEKIKKNILHGFIIQHPYMMGYLGLVTLDQVMHGKKVAMNIKTPVVFVTKENIQSSKVLNILNLE